MKPLREADPAGAAGDRERLSGIVDGECPSGDLDDACRRWAADEGLRRDWHLYHLIGDVLRSEELSAPCADDGAFLSGLRTRLASEPTPLAPAPLARSGRTAGENRRAILPLMVAGLAGVMVAGSAVWLLRPASDAPGAGWGDSFVSVPELASPVYGSYGLTAAMPAVTAPEMTDAWNAPGTFAVPAAAGAGPAVRPLDRRLLRDARLDAYIEAHRDMLAPLPVAMPGAAMRGADIRAAQR